MGKMKQTTLCRKLTADFKSYSEEEPYMQRSMQTMIFIMIHSISRPPLLTMENIPITVREAPHILLGVMCELGTARALTYAVHCRDVLIQYGLPIYNWVENEPALMIGFVISVFSSLVLMCSESAWSFIIVFTHLICSYC